MNFSKWQTSNDSCYMCVAAQPKLWVMPLPYAAWSTEVTVLQAKNDEFSIDRRSVGSGRDCMIVRGTPYTRALAGSFSRCPEANASGSEHPTRPPPIWPGSRFECFQHGQWSNGNRISAHTSGILQTTRELSSSTVRESIPAAMKHLI